MLSTQTDRQRIYSRHAKTSHLTRQLKVVCLQVTREERRLAHDKSVYQRIKQAYAASGGAAAGRKAALAAAGGSSAWSATVEVGPGTGGAAGRRSNAAGAVAAAARELRPVELVGIYEGQKEALEKELAAARAEVRDMWLALCSGGYIQQHCIPD
jgi:hypothetical protein